MVAILVAAIVAIVVAIVVVVAAIVVVTAAVIRRRRTSSLSPIRRIGWSLARLFPFCMGGLARVAVGRHKTPTDLDLTRESCQDGGCRA
jgi:cytochrome c oxidase assembly factor CtaG